MKKHNKSFYRLIKKTIKFFYGKIKFIGIENITNESCVIVSNHAQAHGPICFEGYFPKAKKIWCIGEVMDAKEFPDYAMRDFWLYKPKRSLWFYKIIAKIMAKPLDYVFNSADTIPVYKDARILSTLKKSISALEEGNNVVIFAEKREKYNEIINNFYDNFIDIAKLYHNRNGKELNFVPAYVAPSLKKVVLGKPIKYNSSLSQSENKATVSNYLKEEITSLAKSLPVHTVVPYDNIPKKKYKKSK